MSLSVLLIVLGALVEISNHVDFVQVGVPAWVICAISALFGYLRQITGEPMHSPQPRDEKGRFTKAKEKSDD